MRDALKIGLFAAAALPLGLFGVVSPTSAAIVQVTYTGTVASGFDYTGVFGSAGTDLTGDSFTARYLFDTTLGVTYSSSSPAENQAYGGTGFSIPSPSLGAVLTINGQNLAVAGSFLGLIYGGNYGPSVYSEAYHTAQDYSFIGSGFTNKYIDNYIFNYTGTIPDSITSPYKYNVGAIVGANDIPGGEFSDYSYNYIPRYTTEDAFGDLHPSTLTYSVVSDVPEPATLLLLGTGLFGLGLMRLRKAA
jgi:hypothetical protein